MKRTDGLPKRDRDAIAKVVRTVRFTTDGLRITPEGKQPFNIDWTGEQAEVSARTAIYRFCYCAVDDRDVADAEKVIAEDPKADRSIIGMRPFELDWRWRVAEFLNDGAILATAGDRVARLETGSYVRTGDGAIRRYERVGVALWTEWEDKDNDWLFFAHGMRGQRRGGCEMRAYVNVCASGAAPVAEAMFRELSAWRIPFACKLHGLARNYRRADPMVLYFERRDLRVVLERLASLIPFAKPYLRSSVPLFTLPLARGLGLAESPRDGQSFGTSRSLVCARALAQAQTSDTAARRAADIARAFVRSGHSPAELFRNPDDAYGYDYALIGDLFGGR
jgi:hypothetical protein